MDEPKGVIKQAIERGRQQIIEESRKTNPDYRKIRTISENIIKLEQQLG